MPRPPASHSGAVASVFAVRADPSATSVLTVNADFIRPTVLSAILSTNYDTVRIEWPSGTVQELHNVGSNQFLTVTEPARLKGGLSGGQFQLVLNGGVGFRYDLQSSPNLMDWTSLANVMTTNMTMPVLTLDAAQVSQNYFRALRQ